MVNIYCFLPVLLQTFDSSIFIFNLFLPPQWTRDDNDNEWTQQRIAEWEKQIEDENAAIEGLKKDWKEAVDVYHRTPADVVIDLSKITGYTEAVAAIKPFNTAVTDYQKAWTAFENARKAYQKVTNEFWSNKNNINRTYTNDIKPLGAKADEQANAEQARLQKAYNDLVNATTPDATKIQEALDALNAFYWWEFRNESYNELIKPFAEKRDKALKAEDTKRIEAENAVRTTVEAYKAKRDALIAEVDVVTPLYDNFYTNASHRITLPHLRSRRIGESTRSTGGQCPPDAPPHRSYG